MHSDYVYNSSAYLYLWYIIWHGRFAIIAASYLRVASFEVEVVVSTAVKLEAELVCGISGVLVGLHF